MHNYQNLEFYSVNAKIFVKSGLIGSNNRRKQLLISIVPLLTNIGQFMNFFVAESEDFSETGLKCYLLGITTSILIRQMMVMWNDEKFVHLLQCVERWYHEIERNENSEVLCKLRDVTKHAKKLTGIGFSTAGVCAMFGVIYPLSFRDRKFVVPVYYPFFDVRQTPFYEVCFLLQAVVLIPTFCFVYLPFTNLLVGFLMFGEVVLLDLRVKLNNICNNGDKVEMLRDLKECIAYHCKIVEFRNKLEDLVSIVNFFDVALFGSMFCMMLFFISMVNDIESIVTALVYISFAFYAIAISYFYADKFTNESIKVCDAAYDTPWYEGNLEMRKCVLIMIARSQRPLHITAGGVYPMTMATFQAIIRISYSYFSMLQGLNQ